MIKIGQMYSNGKGRIRKVIDMGPQYVLYPGQVCSENLLYEVVSDGSVNNREKGNRYLMTVASFASWAKKIVEDPV